MTEENQNGLSFSRRTFLGEPIRFHFPKIIHMNKNTKTRFEAKLTTPNILS